MGCVQSRSNVRNVPSNREDNHDNNPPESPKGFLKEFRNYKWTSENDMTLEQIEAEREAFWETSPVYEGKPEIWAAIRKICESTNLDEAQEIVKLHQLNFTSGHLIDGCYDSLGNFYSIPPYCFSLPNNLIKSPCSEPKKEIKDITENAPLLPPDLSIKIRFNSGEDVTLNVSKLDTISQVLIRLANEKGWTENGTDLPKVRFIYLGKILSPKDTLAKLKIASEVVLQAQISI